MNQQLEYTKIQQQQLAKIQEDYQTALTRVQVALPSNTIATTEQIASAINLVDYDANYFQTAYGPVSNTLNELGFSQLSVRLEQILADLQTARAKYVELYQERTNPTPSATPIPPITTNTTGVPLPDPNAQVYADLSETCVHCHYYLGDKYWMLTICPNCQLLLRPSSMPQWTTL